MRNKRPRRYGYGCHRDQILYITKSVGKRSCLSSAYNVISLSLTAFFWSTHTHTHTHTLVFWSGNACQWHAPTQMRRRIFQAKDRISGNCVRNFAFIDTFLSSSSQKTRIRTLAWLLLIVVLVGGFWNQCKF